jgi:2-succinyl-5-enolpyruvyl-6-hydroxy-3-cyclohexene-1-carboxylate synthase
MNEVTRRFVTAPHQASADGWVKERNFLYLSAHNAEELAEAIATFTQPEEAEQPMFLEVFTDKEEDVRLLKDYFHSLKQK